MAGSTLLIATVIANAVWAGFLLTVRPTLLMPTPGRYRGLRTAFLVLLVPLMLVCGVFIDKWGVQTVLLLGGSMAALAFLSLDRSDSLPSAIGAVALLAGAAAALMVGSTVIMPLAFFPGRTARSVNFGFIALMAGILAGQSLTPWLLKKLGLRKTLLAAALCSLLPAAATGLTSPAEFGLAGAGSDVMQLRAEPRLGLQLLMIALCFPLETALGPWIRRYTGELGYVPGSALGMATGFWLAFFGARLAAAFFLPAGGESLLLLVLVMLAAVTFGNMLGAYAPASNSLGVLLTGVCCGALVPTVIGLVLLNNPENAGPAAGLAFAVGMLGNLLVLPWIDASRVERSSRTAMAGATALAVLLLAPALVLVLLG